MGLYFLLSVCFMVLYGVTRWKLEYGNERRRARCESVPDTKPLLFYHRFSEHTSINQITASLSSNCTKSRGKQQTNNNGHLPVTHHHIKAIIIGKHASNSSSFGPPPTQKRQQQQLPPKIPIVGKLARKPALPGIVNQPTLVEP